MAAKDAAEASGCSCRSAMAGLGFGVLENGDEPRTTAVNKTTGKPSQTPTRTRFRLKSSTV